MLDPVFILVLVLIAVILGIIRLCGGVIESLLFRLIEWHDNRMAARERDDEKMNSSPWT